MVCVCVCLGSIMSTKKASVSRKSIVETGHTKKIHLAFSPTNTISHLWVVEIANLPDSRKNNQNNWTWPRFFWGGGNRSAAAYVTQNHHPLEFTFQVWNNHMTPDLPPPSPADFFRSWESICLPLIAHISEFAYLKCGTRIIDLRAQGLGPYFTPSRAPNTSKSILIGT